MIPIFASKTLEDIITSLPEDKKSILINRYGLLDKKQSFDEIGTTLSVSRQRVHQIIQNILKSIREVYDSLDIIEMQNLITFANEITPIDTLDSISYIYKNKGLLELIIDIFPFLGMIIYKDKNLDIEVLINKDLVTSFSNKIQDIIDNLKHQKEFVSIKELTTLFDCKPEIIKNLSDIIIHDEHIALKSNKDIAQGVFGVIFQTLKSANKPLKIDEIVKISGLSKNQVRSRLDRDRGKFFVNIGKSMYALTEWDFSRLQTNELIYQYIKSSSETKTVDEVVNFVLIHKRITKTSILIATSLDPRIVSIKPGIYSLLEWGAIPYKQSHSYNIECSEGLITILKNTNVAMSISEIVEELDKHFGNKITKSRRTIWQNLSKMKKKGEIEIISGLNKKFTKYKLIRT
jgi:predicted DNA-binding protein YlxM (UPF0122 family)